MGDYKHLALTTFADKRFSYFRNHLVISALRFGITGFYIYSEKDLKESSFYSENRKILDYPRGAGYWLWKPYFILETLNRLNDGELLLYLDAGIRLLCAPHDFIRISLASHDVALFSTGYVAKYWTKRDAYVYMDADSPEFWETEQVASGVIALRKTNYSIRFIESWLDYCKVEQIITDEPSNMGKPEFPGFKEHRHDQAILTILAKKEKLPLHRTPHSKINLAKFPQDTYPKVFELYSHAKRKTALKNKKRKECLSRIRRIFSFFKL